MSTIITAALLFVPAGSLAWPQAWAFLALFGGCSLVLGLWLRQTNPDLLAERMRPPLSADQRPRDRFVMWSIILFFAAWLACMALDARRFGWSHTPFWGQVIGAALIVAAFWGWADVLRTNSFAATKVRLQVDRGQTVISAGPYAIVRHPMYAYVIPLLIGTPLLLGSLWGLLGTIVALPLMAARALGEEDLLMDGLPGYRDYASRVRFRLIPGVW